MVSFITFRLLTKRRHSTGRHGSPKYLIQGTDVFTGKTHDDMFPSYQHRSVVPNLHTQEYLVITFSIINLILRVPLFRSLMSTRTPICCGSSRFISMEPKKRFPSTSLHLLFLILRIL